jgi:hypothetical protein
MFNFEEIDTGNGGDSGMGPTFDTRRPFLYFPQANHIVMGEPGTHHDRMTMQMIEQGRYPRGGIGMRGMIFPQYNNQYPGVHWWKEMPAEQRQPVDQFLRERFPETNWDQERWPELHTAAYETDPESGKRVWDFQKSLDQNLPTWEPHTEGSEQYTMMAQAVRGFLQSMKRPDISNNDRVFEMVMNIIANKPASMHPTTEALYGAVQQALQLIEQRGAIHGEGSPEIYQAQPHDSVRFNELGERQFDQAPEGLTKQIPGWGKFPGYVGDPHFPARMRWTKVTWEDDEDYSESYIDTVADWK